MSAYALRRYEGQFSLVSGILWGTFKAQEIFPF